MKMFVLDRCNGPPEADVFGIDDKTEKISVRKGTCRQRKNPVTTKVEGRDN